ncbi:DUF445 domain-containing protein [Pueribacillus theae]|uniref:DUF445 domain-containing protein n=1 Tax=Pueribacillus theae TaxID=2171751 RepID=A0A2U1JUL3_9BACI|nr:DUF445 family protein [Pueribacillus theae]PWA08528.1 DUF445 domain-containing protein [Pueribacillus theae]
MNIFLSFFMLITVGAIIGGATNFLAIKMLFRPLKPIYIGKWRLPFTPGLIPKRRDDMAVQLGKVVVEHLLTAEGIVKKLKDHQFRNDILKLAKTEVAQFLEREDSLLRLAGRLGISQADERIEQFIQHKLEEKYWLTIQKIKSKSIHEMMPDELEAYIELKMPSLAETICSKAVAYFESDEGKRKVGELISHFLADKGKLGNVITMFLGNESLLNKVQPEIIKFFKQPAAKQLFQRIMEKEWASLKEKQLSDFDERVNYEKFLEWLKEQMLHQFAIGELFNTSVNELAGNYKDRVIESLVPNALQQIGNYAVSKIDAIMQKLPLAAVVKEQVESFPVERLETIVLAISSKEFKMITYLGALLGGIIGAVQGVLILFLN